MAKWILPAVLAVPIVEIALFVEIGGLVGVWATLALVLLSAAAGVVLIRVQGVNALARLAASLETGRDPAGPLAHGALLLVAGVLLLVPGFFTDAVALLLLVPPVREALIRWGAARFTVRATGFAHPRPAPEVIDADYEVVEDPGPAARGRSGWTGRP
jgi:UPF0716 protein FxsA